MEINVYTLHYKTYFDGAVCLGTFSSELITLDTIKNCIENDLMFFSARNIRLREMYFSTGIGNLSILENSDLILKDLKQEFQKIPHSLESYNLFLTNKNYLLLLGQQKKFIVTRHKINEIIDELKTKTEEFGCVTTNPTIKETWNLK